MLNKCFFQGVEIMKRMIAVGLGLLLILVGCSSKTMVESDLGIKGAPDWVNEGTQILNDKGLEWHTVQSWLVVRWLPPLPCAKVPL